MKRFLSLTKRRTSILVLLFLTMSVCAETETALIITPRSGSKQQHALAQIGHVKLTGDSLLVYSQENKVLGRNAIADIQYVKYDDYVANPSGTCGDSLTWEFNPADSTLTISGSGAMNNFSSSNMPWAEYRQQIVHLAIEEGATTIGNYAFYNCTNLQNITIPSTLTSIGGSVFSYCDSLSTIYWNAANYIQTTGYSPFVDIREHVTEFTIGPDVISLPQYLCINFSALTALDIPATVRTLGTSTFDGCSSLSDLTLHEGLDSIGEYAFKNCSTLTELTIPQSVSWIGHNAFEACTSLSSLTLNDNDKALKDNVFKYCNNLTELTIPDAWHSIPNQAFRDVTGLEQVILPDSLDTIGDGAFSYCKKLRSISIPSTLKHIGGSAFDNCDSLSTIYWNAANFIQTTGYSPFGDVREHVTEFTIGPDVISLPQYLCINFSALTALDIPATVRTLGTSTFDGCSSLSDLTLHEGLDSIGEYAFKNCSTLTELTIPQSVSWIGHNAFESCASLSSVTLNDNDKALQTEVFKYCNNLTELTIPDAWHSIPNQAFRDMAGLEQVILPDSLDTIGNSAFSYCRKLRAISIPTTLKFIDNYAFDYCDSLRSIYWDAADFIHTRSTSPFHEVRSNVTEFTIGPNVTSLPQFLCFNFSALTSVEIPATVRTLGTSAFDGCSSLSDLTWYEGLDSIGEYAFKNCTSLTELTIPQSVSWIGRNAFESCPLTKLTSLATTPPVITDNTFCNVDKSISVYVPAGTRSLYRAATGWSDFTNYVALPCDTTLTDTVTATITEGSTYEWQGRDLTEAGIYSDTLRTEDGCDSICTLVLTVEALPNPSGQCGDSLWWEYLPETHTLVFSGSGAMYDLTQSAPWALEGLRDSIWHIQFSDSMTTIANQAFIHCREMTEVTIPNSVTEIHTQAFEQCEGLRKVTLPNNLTQLGANAFNNCYRLSEINIPSSLTEIASGAFYNCDSLSNIQLPNTITRIGSQAFRHIESLVSITLPSSVTYLDDYVFADCWNLESIQFSNNITYIGGRVFENCGSLQSVVLPDSLEQILTETFRNCTGLTSVTFPEREVRIGSGLFNSCTSLSHVHIGEGTTSMEAYAFANCTSLHSIVLPSTMSSVEMNAFEYCTGLDTLTSLAIVPPYLGEDAFTEVDSMIPFYVPARSARAYRAHGRWSYFKNIIGLPCDTTFYANDSVEICDNETYTWHERTLTETGIYTDTLPTIDGCDSICTLHLTVNTAIDEPAVDLPLCESHLPYNWLGRIITETGVYHDTVRNISGCDSIRRTLNVTVIPTITTDVTATICEGETYIWDKETYTQSGDYSRTYYAEYGCDSIVTLHLTVLQAIDAAIEDSIVCEGDMPIMWRGKSIAAAGLYHDTVRSATGCDSLRYTLNLTVLTMTYAPAIDTTVCEGDATLMWRGKVWPVADTTYYDTQYYSMLGCDSALYTLNVTVNRATYAPAEGWTICENSLPFSWRDMSITAAGTYYDTTYYASGCVSAYYTLNLTVNSNYETEESATICESEMPYIWHGENYYQTGDYETTLASITGCDSIVTLHLTVQQVTDAPAEDWTICESSLPFTWRGISITASGTYHDTVRYTTGCDSLRCTLNLTVNETYQVTDEASICEGETYTWHGRALTKKGTYVDTLQSLQGCDSICTLVLTVNEKYLIEDIVSVREDKLPYIWQGEEINQSGDYRKEYTASTGCDSVHTLHFTVTALPIYTVNVVADHGRVNGTGTYPEGTRIYLTAVPDEGFEFQMWSDGGETNPKEFVVTQDTTLRAHFYMPEVEQEVTVDSIETTSVTIIWDTVANAILYELRIYKNGELIVTFEVDPDNNIVGVHHIGPDRLVARKDSTGGSSETLQVNVGGLNPGSDYTYSLDAMADDRSFVGAQSGSFTTEEEPIDRLDTLFDDRRTAPRKLLRDGRLYIEMPDGTQYDARGVLVE